MVISAGLCIFVYIYYLFLYSPLNNQVIQKKTQLIEKAETLAWMQKVKLQGPSSKTKQKVDNSQLLTLFATELKNHPTLKFPYQLQQTGSGDIQLTFDAVPFTSFIEWLAALNERYAINIKQFDAQQSQTAGITKLMIVLSAPT